MAVRQGIQVESTGILPAQEVGPDFKFWMSVVDAQVFNPCCKALVQPKVGPPLHGDLCMCMTARYIMHSDIYDLDKLQLHNTLHMMHI